MITTTEYKIIHQTLADLAAKYLWNGKREMKSEAIQRASNRRARANNQKTMTLG